MVANVAEQSAGIFRILKQQNASVSLHAKAVGFH
jgi:hypothetical protein